MLKEIPNVRVIIKEDHYYVQYPGIIDKKNKKYSAGRIEEFDFFISKLDDEVNSCTEEMHKYIIHGEYAYTVKGLLSPKAKWQKELKYMPRLFRYNLFLSRK